MQYFVQGYQSNSLTLLHGFPQKCDEEILDLVEAEKRGTVVDRRDVNRMGRLPQLRVCNLPCKLILPPRLIKNRETFASLQFSNTLWLWGPSHVGICVCVSTSSLHDPLYFGNQCFGGLCWCVYSIVAMSLMNGGTARKIWRICMVFVVCVGMFYVVLSLAEMASMQVRCWLWILWESISKTLIGPQ